MKIPATLTKSLKLLLTALLLLLVFRSVDLSGITRDLGTFDRKALVLLLAACWAGQLLCSARWRLLATALQMKGSYGSFARIYFTGMFFNIGLPSLIGGDAVKAYLISRSNGKPLHIGVASVLQDRAVGLISLLAYGSLAVLLYPISFRGLPLWTFYALLWAAIATSVWFVLKGKRWHTEGLPPHATTFLHKTLRKLAELHRSLQLSRPHPRTIFLVALYSFIYSGLVLLVFQQITVAAGYNVGILPFSALFPLITVVTMLPVTVGGLGVREWVYMEALALVGIPRDAGLLISLATSALFLLCNLGGIIFVPGIRPLLASPVKTSDAV